MTPADFFARAIPAAVRGGHIWPEYAVCEAAEESAWGASELARVANNLFGLKQGACTPGYPTIELPTTEYVDGQYRPVAAIWPRFKDWEDSFAVRMKVLEALAPEFPHYAAALAATDGPHFIIEVSETWSTDPGRARKILLIHADNAALIHKIAADSFAEAAPVRAAAGAQPK